MMKMMKALVVMALVLLMAAPAFAEFQLSGYYRLQGTWAEEDNTNNDDYKTVTQRVRIKMDKAFSENVGLVYFIESDLDWGENGDLGVDDKNIETKNAYLYINGDVFSTKLGAQGYTDIFNGLIVSEDMMAATAKFTLGAADLDVIYAKLAEGLKTVDDDLDFYGATVGFAATDSLRLTGGVWVLDQSADLSADEYTAVIYGARVDAALSDMLDLSVFGLIQDLEDGDSYALAANAKIKLANGAIMLEGLYIPEDDTATGEDTFVQMGDGANAFYYNGTPFMFLKRDIYATNNGVGEGKYNDDLEDGLTMLSGYGQFNFAGLYAGAGVAWAEGEDFEIGTEFVAMVGKKFFSNVDVSLRAAQFEAGESTDNDETKVIGMVNVGF